MQNLLIHLILEHLRQLDNLSLEAADIKLAQLEDLLSQADYHDQLINDYLQFAQFDRLPVNTHLWFLRRFTSSPDASVEKLNTLYLQQAPLRPFVIEALLKSGSDLTLLWETLYSEDMSVFRRLTLRELSDNLIDLDIEASQLTALIRYELNYWRESLWSRPPVQLQIRVRAESFGGEVADRLHNLLFRTQIERWSDRPYLEGRYKNPTALHNSYQRYRERSFSALLDWYLEFSEEDDFIEIGPEIHEWFLGQLSTQAPRRDTRLEKLTPVYFLSFQFSRRLQRCILAALLTYRDFETVIEILNVLKGSLSDVFIEGERIQFLEEMADTLIELEIDPELPALRMLLGFERESSWMVERQPISLFIDERARQIGGPRGRQLLDLLR